jgi:ABC-type lipoprotein export system ATPase subunit/uncharacterized OsmC-like protein
VRVFGLGTVEARVLSKIGFEVGAAITELNADHGDQVKQGQVLARLHATQQEAKVARAKAAVLSAEVAVKKADANVVKAQAIPHRHRERPRHRGAPRLREVSISFSMQRHPDWPPANLLPFLNATDNVAIVLQLAGKEPAVAQKRASDLLDYLEVGRRKSAFPAKLSGGKAQRAAIARALANHPRIILADEPTAALDSKRAQIVMDLLRKLALDQNAAVIAVTHDEKIFDRFDRMFMLRDGPAGGHRAYAGRRVNRSEAIAGLMRGRPEKREEGHEMHECKVAVVESGNGPYGQFITCVRHVLGADEPVEMGGQNTGPDPFELLLAALGACTAMTIRMYAKRKNLPLDRVEVKLRHVQRAAGVDIKDRFERVITLHGRLSIEERKHLLAIDERCPVSQTLKRSSDITSLLVEGTPGPPDLSAM